MSERARIRKAISGIVIGGALALGAAVLAWSSPLLSANPALTWAVWLQFIVNLMKVLELGTFIFSAYQFWAGRRERIAADAAAAQRAVIDTNYQAWQVINSAQGKGGSGGRIEALADLLRNGVSLAGINLDGAWLEKVRLPGAILTRASLQRTTLVGAVLSGAHLEGADLCGADLAAADLTNAYLRGVNFAEARLSAARLDGADLTDITGWREVRSYGHTSLLGVRNAPPGFLDFARERGAIDERFIPDEDEHTGFSRELRAV